MYQKKPFQIKSNGGKRNPGFKVFTLIELLVVVAIIAVLVAMLLPSIQKVRKRAKILTCGSQMRQIGIALYAYAGANNDFFPPFYVNPDNPSDRSRGTMDWRNLPGPLEKSGILRAPAVYYCPDGCPWGVSYPKSVGYDMGYYVRWGIFYSNPYKPYSLRDPSGIVLVTEPCGWWGYPGAAAWSHPATRGFPKDNGFNCLYLDGSVYYFSTFPDWLAAADGSIGNYWAPFDRKDFDEEWYRLKGEY
jgi:prepilin-type N-terminal cleavage/methylation domain-containing protein/prepilin-type processing-associated H-X9-DG protein